MRGTIARGSGEQRPKDKLWPGKTFEIQSVREEAGFFTPRRIEAVRHESGHRSVFSFSEVDYESPVSDEIFTVRTLQAERGRHLLPRKPD